LIVILLLVAGIVFLVIYIQQSSAVCDPPYIRVGTGCCLDKNQNSICDRDEPVSLTGGAPEGTLPEEKEPMETTPQGNGSNEGAPEQPETTPEELETPEGQEGNDTEGADNIINETLINVLPAAICGDGLCYFEENSTTCPRDCGCPPGEILYGNLCHKFFFPKVNITDSGFDIPPIGSFEICGNDYCNTRVENSSNCCDDCGCPPGSSCFGHSCFLDIDIIGPIKIPEPEPQRPPCPEAESYIVVIIEEVRINNDEDSMDSGELMLVTGSGSGERGQKANWPYKMWYNVNDGDVIKKRIPIFALKEEEMGDFLVFSIGALDDDQPPGVLGWFLDFAALPLEIVEKVIDLPATLVGAGELEDELAGEIHSQLSRITNTDLIGSMVKAYSKSDDWGVRDRTYTESAGGMTVKYSIKRVKTHKGSSLGVRLYTVRISDNEEDGPADLDGAEIWLWLRVATKFYGSDYNGKTYRLPADGTYDRSDDDFLIYNGDDPILTYSAYGPFIFFDVAAWEEDTPEYGNEHDSLGTATWLYLYSDFEGSPQTEIAEPHEGYISFAWRKEGRTTIVPFATLGNTAVYFELTKTEPRC
jgi:hypothetical protein